MQSYTQETFLSPFTWRYGGEAMRQLWSEVEKRKIWRRIWVALASVQAHAGLVTQEQVEDLIAHREDIDLERAEEIERALRHDLMAEVRTYAEQCSVGGGIIHLGATSMDVEDNADALRIREALRLVRGQMVELLGVFADQIEAQADSAIMAYTHIQPAELTTVGYRLSQYAQDLLSDLAMLDDVLARVRGKGIKGATGTSASYDHLLEGLEMTPAEMERLVMEQLDLEPFPVATQTYPRKMDYHVLVALAGIAQSAYKFSLDLRLLQSPVFGEMAEPFGKSQVGSSAMPFKRNPITSESICSLARYVAGLPRVAWDNAAHSALERTLDDSANRRVVLPEAFLAVDNILTRMTRVVRGLRFNKEASARNLAAFGPFAATEPLLMALVKAGASRQDMHERIRDCSMEAWAAMQAGEGNALVDVLVSDEDITAWLPAERVKAIIGEGAGVGRAAEQSRAMAQDIRHHLS